MELQSLGAGPRRQRRTGRGTPLDKFRSLAIIDDTRLSPYVGQRFTEVWKKFFENCSGDDKIEATKLRILREYQP